jgi:uncharacterized RDD family membrane protein YckC
MTSQELTQVRRATLWRRIAAYSLDSLFMIAPVALVGNVVLSHGDSFGGSFIRGAGLGLAAYFAYFLLDARGGTLGKRVFKLRVERRSGDPLGYGFVAARSLARIASMVSLIGFAIALVDPQQRALHDFVTRTRVRPYGSRTTDE